MTPTMRVRASHAGVTLDHRIDHDLRSHARYGLVAPERVPRAAGEVFDCPLDQLALTSDNAVDGWMEPALAGEL